MKINEKRIPEIFFAIILVILLIILVFLFTSISAIGKSTSTTSAVSDSYNVNSYNTNYYFSSASPSTIKYSQDKDYSKYYDKTYRYLKYSERAGHKINYGAFGNEINRYYVYVKNKDYKSGYFTVKFHFYDCCGKTKTVSVRHYIKSGKEEKFFYQSIYSDKYEYHDWDYEVVSETKISR